MSNLPPAFIERMSQLLGDELDDLIASYAQPPRMGLRLNTLRALLAFSGQLSAFPPVPWCPTGRIIPGDAATDLARHAYHAAGVYYLQEPSAMAPAEILSPQPGEVVLDLCAAPGGKTTQIAALMNNTGLLVANDPHPRRVRALAMNLERCGVTCAVALNETPQRLAARWPGLFDRVLVDAPCSGQGMFRKSARAEWQPGHIKTDAARQSAILDAAARLVRPGGVIVYSTCTFEPDENEGNLARFIRRHADFEIDSIEHRPGFAPGRPEWADGNPALAKTVRLWPHLSVGEGHFIAKLRRRDAENAEKPYQQNLCGLGASAVNLLREFCEEHLQLALWEKPNLLQAGHEVYLVPPHTPDLRGLRVVRWGWWIGTLKGQVFTPGHALAMALTPADVRQSLNLPADDPRTAAFLRGESLHAPGEPGWILITVDGLPLGWGKRAGSLIKNRRPPGLAQKSPVSNRCERNNMRALLLALVAILVAGIAGSVNAGDLPAHRSPAEQVQDIASYWIDVELDPATKTLQGRETLTYLNASPDALPQLAFHLYLNAFAGPNTTFMRESGGNLRGFRANPDAPGWIEVDSIRLGNTALDAAYNDDRTVMTVTLPAPLAPGATLELDIAFHAQLPQVFARTGWAPNDFFMVAQWFPKIAVYDDLGWHSWPFHANAEFFADFGDYEVNITVPQSFVIGATGFPQTSRNNGDGTKTETYYAPDVIDFAWTASPHYQTATRKWNDVEIVLLYQPEHRAYVNRYLTAAEQALEFYGQHIGPYAYKRLTIGAPPANAMGAGGMEYPMFFMGSSGMLGLPILPAGEIYEIEVVSLHEAAHNWFGMVVATNEAEEPWLDEGFTDFVSVEAATHYYGQNTSMLSAPYFKIGYFQMRRIEYLAMPNVPCYGKAWEFKGLADYGVGTYSKPVMVLTTLKNMLGKETLWKILQTYYARYKFKHPRTTDFIAVAEEISGQQLDWFFDQAIYGSGTLDYAVEAVSSERQPNGNYESQIVVTSKGQVAFPTELRVAFTDGRQTSAIWDGRVDQAIGRQIFTYTHSASLAWAHLDPDRKLAMELVTLDNSRALAPQYGSTARIGSRILFWIQNLFLLLGGI